MEKQEIIKAIKEAKENSKKRNFIQSIDLIINLRGLNLKKAEEQIEKYVVMPHNRGKEPKICALVGRELLEEAKKEADTVISVDEFNKYAKDKKITKKLAKEHDFFIAQANVMPKVAAAFGRVLGPKGKMPNPKAGCVVPPNAQLKPLVEKLKKTLKIAAKEKPLIQVKVGTEKKPEEEVVENISAIYETVLHSLPGEKNNIKNVYVKLTMGKSIKIKI